MDIISAIDHAIGCHQCGGSLDASPSDDFCGQDCQEAWAAGRTEPLVGYREPWEFGPGGYEGYRPHRTIDHEPRPEADGWRELSRVDLVAMPRAELDALTGGRVYVADPGTQPGAMTGTRYVVSTTSDSGGPIRDPFAFYALFDRARREVAGRQQERVSALRENRTAASVEVTFEPVGVNWDLMRRYYGLGEPAHPHAPEGPADPRERALWLRRNRNTGPAGRQRPPRTIDARRSR